MRSSCEVEAYRVASCVCCESQSVVTKLKVLAVSAAAKPPQPPPPSPASPPPPLLPSVEPIGRCSSRAAAPPATLALPESLSQLPGPPGCPPLCVTMRRAASVVRRPAVSPRALEEMMGLAVADPGRWTAEELAARYDAEPRTAAAVVALARRRRAAAEATRSGRRDAVARRWEELSAPVMGGRRRTGWGAAEAAEAAEAAGGRTSSVAGFGNVLPSFTMVDEVHEAVLRREAEAEMAAVVAEKENEGKSAGDGVAATGAPEVPARDGAVEGASAVDGQEEVAEDEKELSATGKWVQELLDSDCHVEVSRKTSYAFIEAGVPDSAHRAVWIRDGPSGKLRAPTDTERRHLLGGRAQNVKIRRKP